MAPTLSGDRTGSWVRMLLFLSLVVIVAGNCAGIAAKSRAEQFGRTAKAYEWALESANYRDAATYLDAAALKPIDFKHYTNIKVAQYTILQTRLSEDRRSVRQDVELQYYLVDQSILKITVDHQVWHYSEAREGWLLKSGLPVFPR